jgi:hypothetical protein
VGQSHNEITVRRNRRKREFSAIEGAEIWEEYLNYPEDVDHIVRGIRSTGVLQIEDVACTGANLQFSPFFVTKEPPYTPPLSVFKPKYEPKWFLPPKKETTGIGALLEPPYFVHLRSAASSQSYPRGVFDTIDFGWTAAKWDEEDE